MPPSQFDCIKTRGNARLGRLQTPHGVVHTPAFIFCATKGAMKAMTMEQVRACESQIILSNTYHLMLQPGPDVVHTLGGLQTMTGWNGPMLTDSGGFQIFSLGHGSVANEIKGRRAAQRPNTLLQLDESGATFQSYIDGRRYHLTPEESIRIQCHLGADLIVVLDECTPYHVDRAYTEASMERSHRWALRCLQAHQQSQALSSMGKSQALYGIVQGGVYPDLRKRSCEFVQAHPFFGVAVGGSLGASSAQMHEVVTSTLKQLSTDRPVHLLGIGGIRDILHGVQCGIDTFDCVHPTRIARHGGALIWPQRDSHREHLNLRNASHRYDSKPIESNCPCSTCQRYSRAYLHHLLKAKEMTAYILLSIHNVTLMNRLMTHIRAWIRGEVEDLL
jgi:queuine tRNA-ribosyltransferase